MERRDAWSIGNWGPMQIENSLIRLMGSLKHVLLEWDRRMFGGVKAIAFSFADNQANRRMLDLDYVRVWHPSSQSRTIAEKFQFNVSDKLGRSWIASEKWFWFDVSKGLASKFLLGEIWVNSTEFRFALRAWASAKEGSTYLQQRHLDTLCRLFAVIGRLACCI
jgi:hypothetical protein